jgi:hypothetical protein
MFPEPKTPMKNREKIEAVLSRLAPGAGICDDCLGRGADVGPRQTVNRICREQLEAEGLISRMQGSCSAGHHNIDKILNVPCSEGIPSTRTPNAAPLGEQTNVLSQWLFDAVKFLDRTENLSLSNEPFAGRVSRLRRESIISASLSTKMQILNNYRVQVVKERKALDFQEWELAKKYVDECRSDWIEVN